MSAYDTREWRVGTHYGVHVYAVNPSSDRDDDEPIASFLGAPAEAKARAEQMVAEHAMLSAPYADEQHQGGHWLDVLPQRPRWAPEGVETQHG